MNNPENADYKVTVEDMIAEGDKVAIRQTYHTKGMTGRQATFYRLANGKIVDDWPIFEAVKPR